MRYIYIPTSTPVESSSELPAALYRLDEPVEAPAPTAPKRSKSAAKPSSSKRSRAASSSEGE